MEENQKPNVSEFVEKNYNFIKRLELISFAVLVLGFIFYQLKMNDLKVIFVVGILLTAISLMLQSFKLVEFQDMEAFNILGSIGFVNFLYKLYFLSASISIISLLGFILNFQQGNIFAILGGSTLTIVLILTLFSRIKNKSVVYGFKFYLRILICLFFIGILAFEKGLLKN